MVNKKIVDEKNGKLCKCLFRVLLLLSVVTSACAKENGSPTVTYDIKAETLKCRDPFIYLHEPTGIYYLHVNGGGKIS